MVHLEDRKALESSSEEKRDRDDSDSWSRPIVVIYLMQHTGMLRIKKRSSFILSKEHNERLSIEHVWSNQTTFNTWPNILKVSFVAKRIICTELMWKICLLSKASHTTSSEVTPQNEHNFRHHFLAQFFHALKHGVICFSPSCTPETTFWLVGFLQQSIRNSYACFYTHYR